MICEISLRLVKPTEVKTLTPNPTPVTLIVHAVPPAGTGVSCNTCPTINPATGVTPGIAIATEVTPPTGVTDNIFNVAADVEVITT